AAKGIVNANGFANFARGWADGLDGGAENEFFNASLNVVIEFVTVSAEELNAVVVVGVVGGGDDDACVCAQAPRGVRDARSRGRTDEEDIDTHGKDAGGN